MTRDEAKKAIENAVRELNEALKNGRSDTLKRYLDLLSRFHRYSFNNAILIDAQRPDAMHVAGFHSWRKLGRYVRKGERGIGILAPMVYRRHEDVDARGTDEDKGRRLAGFRVAHVFDISQTDGDELPELARVTGDPGEKLQQMERAIRDADIEIHYEFLGQGILGGSSGGRITVRPDLEPARKFAVLAHEFAHELLHQKEVEGDAKPSKTVRETEAEAVSHVVCGAFGLNTTAHSADYIQLYHGDTKTLGSSLDRIQKTAATIIGSIEKPDAERLSVSLAS